MIPINITDADNPYYTCSTVSSLSMSLSKYLASLENIHYLSLLLSYGKVATPTTDLFQFLKPKYLNRLRGDQKTILCYDSTFEGYGHLTETLAKALDHSCTLHNINPKKVFLFTGNLKEPNFEIGIHVVPMFLLDIGYKNDSIKEMNRMEQSQALCSKNLKNLALSLSRRNRIHRVFAHFALYNSPIFKDCIVSQDKITSGCYIDQGTLSKLNLTLHDYEQFKLKLPIVADGNNFHINAPFDPLIELHASTAFSIVNETLTDNENDTSLFFSEKFLKPIINFQPMLIYGQPGINKKLTMLGFKTYEPYFNLDFDNESDNILRYKKLLASATEAINHLNSLSVDKKIEWRYTHSQILEHNYNTFSEMPYLKPLMSSVRKLIRQVTK